VSLRGLLIGVCNDGCSFKDIVEIFSNLPSNYSSNRGGSRNVEGGVLIACRPVGINVVVALSLPKAVHRGV